ncbi:coilin isoform X2 [Hippopotamus amphibius kiboko]|uniref:coilin isoform X2 n=1 Tax=Hippopotamus amphibius kiboko TaxID=575201 RepID=UPI002599D6AF|nr:coilin isoform X2 [Hippopotamus amphibius kiboko]
MAASETVRLRLQFDYPPPATPHCTSFWLLIDLNRCRVVTDLISLIRQRFGFSSGAPLGLYLEGGLLPPAESARLVRDNDCLRVKLEERGVAESPVTVSNGDSTRLLPRKGKKRAFKLEEDEETELDYKNSKKHWKRHENNSEKTLDLEPKAVTNQSVSKKNKRKNKATCVVDIDDGETERKSPKKKEKREYKKQAKTPKCSKAQSVREWTIQKCSPPKGPPARSSLVKAKRKGGTGVHAEDSPDSSSESESYHESTSDGLSNVILEVRHSSEKISTEVSKEGSSVKTTTANKVAAKTGFTSNPIQDKTSRTSSSSSDSNSESDDQCVMSKSIPECAADFFKTVGLFAGKGCPGPSSQVPNAAGWKQSDSNGGRQALGPPPNVTLPTSLGRGWGRGEDLLSWKGARGRGLRGRGRGRGRAVPCVLNRSADYQKQQQLNEMVTNSSTIIQNPIETHKKDYSLLPLLAAAPQVGEKIAFKE